MGGKKPSDPLLIISNASFYLGMVNVGYTALTIILNYENPYLTSELLEMYGE
jgi:hypothetical protein